MISYQVGEAMIVIVNLIVTTRRVIAFVGGAPRLGTQPFQVLVMRRVA